MYHHWAIGMGQIDRRADSIAFSRNKFAGPPYSRTKIYVAHMPRSSSSSSYRSISAARARPQQQTRRPPLLLSIDGTDGRTDTRPLYDAYWILCGPRNNVKQELSYKLQLCSWLGPQYSRQLVDLIELVAAILRGLVILAPKIMLQNAHPIRPYDRSDRKPLIKPGSYRPQIPPLMLPHGKLH